MTSKILLTGIGIGIGVSATAIALLVIFMSNTIIKNEEGPELSSPYKQSMEIETVAEGLSFPTSMEFIDNENILVLEKDHGTVRLVSPWNGTVEKEPLMKLEVENEAERGLLGVAILKDYNVRIKKYSINNNSSTNTASINNVGDINNGNLYYFKINENRTGIHFVGEENENKDDNKDDMQPGLQQDLVADNKDELSEIAFGTDFGRITYIETGPDGFLYILSFEDGKIYRIVDRNNE